MSFAERIASGVNWEKRIIQELRNRGWQAAPFGQGQLPAQIRSHIVAFKDYSGRPALIRWMPDIVASCVRNGTTKIAMIDAKCCGDDQANYSIEEASLEVAEICVNQLFTPTFFVSQDWNVLTPREIRHRGRKGPEKNNGSGTAYLLVAKRWGSSFDSVFPAIWIDGEELI